MIYQLYAIFFFITLIFIFIGYLKEVDILKIVGYGLIFILGVMLIQTSFFGGVEKCDYLQNYTNSVYSYGNNYSDSYHWDYEYDLNPSENTARLFHVKTFQEYSYTCKNIENQNIGFWVAVLGVLGFASVFVEKKNRREEDD